MKICVLNQFYWPERFLEANSRSADQWILLFVWNPNVSFPCSQEPAGFTVKIL